MKILNKIRLLALFFVLINCTNLTAKSITIEQYGARATYFGIDEDAVFKVYPQQNNTSIVEYTGKLKNVFNVTSAGIDPLEFVAFYSHKNSNIYSETENYFPAMITSRYSICTEYISAIKVRVNFAYNFNSANINNASNPYQYSFTAYGYFFRNNRDAFTKAITDNKNNGAIILENGKTYTVKGGWNASPGRTLLFKAKNPYGIKPRIKISMEDCFTSGPEGFSDPGFSWGEGYNKAFNKNFGSINWFKLKDGTSNNDLRTESVIFDGIDIIPTTYTVPVFQYGSDLGYFFCTDINGAGFSKRELTIKNCDPLAEKKQLEKLNIKLPGNPNWCLPDFAWSNNGGSDDGKDITALQEFKLINTSWYSKGGHNIKAKLRAGNAVIMESTTLNPIEFYVNFDAKKTDWSILPITTQFGIGNNNDEKRRNIKINSYNFSWYQVTGQDWNGGTNRNRLKFWMVDVYYKGKTYTLSFKNNAEFAQENPLNPAKSFGVSYAKYRGFINSETAEMFDRIPVNNDLIPWNGQWGNPNYYGSGVKQKIAPNKLRIFGWALQKGDVISIDNKQLTIIDFAEETTLFEGTDGIVSSIITLSDNINSATPSIKVINAQLSDLITKQETVKIRPYVNRSPFAHNMYTDYNANHKYKNVKFNDDIRATGTADYNSAKLFQCQQYLILENISIPGGKYNELSYASTLRKRNELTGSTLATQISGGQLSWFNMDNANPVEISNRPSFIYSNSNWGFSKIYNPVFKDDKGMVGYTDLGIYITNGKRIKANNIQLFYDSIGRMAGGFGRLFINVKEKGGSLDISNFNMQPSMKQVVSKKFMLTQPEVVMTIQAPFELIANNGNGAIITGFNNELLKNVKISLTNWNLAPSYFHGKFKRGTGNDWPTTNPCNNSEYAKRIRINNQCIDNIGY